MLFYQSKNFEISVLAKTEYPIFYIHMDPYIVGKLGYISQLLTRYYCNLSCTEAVISLPRYTDTQIHKR